MVAYTAIMKLHALLLIGTLTACGDPIGTPCTLESGALGFGFSDDCKGKCMALKHVVCPDQTQVEKAVCSGAEGCTPGSCGQGQVCYTVDDPFDDESYCIPSDYCGAALSAEAIASWEKASFDRAQAVHAAYEAKASKRTGKPTAPAAAPAPPSTATPDPPGAASTTE